MIMNNKLNFYKNLIKSKNLFIISSNSEKLVTKCELIDDKIYFYCNEFVSSFSERFVKIKF